MKILLIACAWVGFALIEYIVSYLMYRATGEDAFDVRLWACVLINPIMLLYVIASVIIWIAMYSCFARKLQDKFGKVCNICEGKIERMIDYIASKFKDNVKNT